MPVPSFIFLLPQLSRGHCIFKIHFYHTALYVYASISSPCHTPLYLPFLLVVNTIFAIARFNCLFSDVFGSWQTPGIALHFSVCFLCDCPACSHVSVLLKACLGSKRSVKRVHENFRAPCGPRHLWQLCLTLGLERRGCWTFSFFFLANFLWLTFSWISTAFYTVSWACTVERVKDRHYQGHAMKKKSVICYMWRRNTLYVLHPLFLSYVKGRS